MTSETRSTSAWKGSLRVRRLAGLLKLLLRNRKAFLGLIVLVGSLSVALSAPILTSYDPLVTIVSGQFSQPVWIRSLSSDTKLSENVILNDDPSFLSGNPFLDMWQYSQDPVNSNVRASFDPSITAPASEGGSVVITYSRDGPPSSSNQKASFNRTLTYPYSGPPSNFFASIKVRPQGATATEPIRVVLSVDRLGTLTGSFVLWRETYNQSLDFTTPRIPINSNLPEYRDKVLQLPATTTLNPAQIIFSLNPGQYRFRLMVEFEDDGTTPSKSASVVIDDFNISLFGTAFGLLGTDGGGRDLFTQLVYGARVSLMVGLVAAALGVSLGLVVGLISGYMGRVVDEVLMRFADMMLVIPGFPLLLVLIAVLGPSLLNLIIVIGVLGWMGFSRLVRSQVLTLKERPFVEAAKASGAGTSHIVTSHILPNIISLTYVNLALSVPGAILSEAALSWLGLYDPTVMSWGRMLFNAQAQGAVFQWWWIVPPGLGIALVSLSFVLIGYALDEIFNPKLRKRQ